MKKLVSLLLTLAIIMCLIPTAAAIDQVSEDGMEIYGINLSNPGDSTLLKLSGSWLLIDTGIVDSSEELIDNLKSYGVTNLDIYISHLHDDHYGGVAAIGECEDITVGTLYLPDPSIGAEYQHQQHFLDKLYKDSGASQVVYLKKGSTFSYGGCRAEVLGPVGEYTVDQFPNEVTEGNSGAVSHYLNNNSLTTKFTCGETSFLATGDIEVEEEAALVRYYINNELDSDILKLAHHGLPTSSSADFLAAVSPEYSFALNSGYSVYTSRKAAAEYGLVYMVADEKQNFGIKASGVGVEVYKGSEKLDGWVSLVGGNGTDGKYNKYYLQNGAVLKGIQTIADKKYYFTSGGCMVKGSYKEGVYSPWRVMEDGSRAFSEEGEMYIGFNKVGDYTFYFDPLTGIKLVGNEAWHLKKIGSNYYALNQNGTVRINGWMDYTNRGVKEYRYFGADGKMLTGWFTLNGKKYYLDPITGFRACGIKKIGGKIYYFEETNGASYLRTNCWKKFSAGYRYFGTDGKMLTGWFTLNGKKYYLDPTTGFRACGLKKISGKIYYFEETNGASYLRTNCWKKFGTRYRYFGAGGEMATGWKKISDKYYYFDKSSGYSYNKTGVKTIDGKKYYMQKSSKGSYRYNKTGWKKFSKKYYYFGKNGVVTTGWKKISSKYYYFDKSKGNVYTKTGLKTIDGKKYYMQEGSKGSYRYNKSGWKKYGKKYRYFGKNGVVTIGWKKIGKAKYYFDKNGYRVTGTKKIAGKTYKFTSSGKLKK